MDNNFSDGFKELIAKTREVAIELGYDYISTIHFLLADYEMSADENGANFWFKNKETFDVFKNNQMIESGGKQKFENVSLPLTKEAETTIRLSIVEMKLQNKGDVYAWHFFIASLKNKESLIFGLFKGDEFSLANLTRYYNNLIKNNYLSLIPQKGVDNSTEIFVKFLETRSKLGLFKRVKKLFNKD